MVSTFITHQFLSNYPRFCVLPTNILKKVTSTSGTKVFFSEKCFQYFVYTLSPITLQKSVHKNTSRGGGGEAAGGAGDVLFLVSSTTGNSLDSHPEWDLIVSRPQHQGLTYNSPLFFFFFLSSGVGGAGMGGAPSFLVLAFFTFTFRASMSSFSSEDKNGG